MSGHLRRYDRDAWADAVRSGDRATLARAITLVESTRDDHRAQAQDLLTALLPDAGGAHRVGVTGVPGSGKSTFVDELGTRLTGSGHRVAVLAVDPSSTRRGGSILGDKTRMERLSVDPAAFIRPSPSAGTLGGVARATREAIVLVEAAGFDTVLVETVGVGQSETTVAGMVDTFLVLMVARTGDALQGIKRGVLELAEVIAVNKADGEHVTAAGRAASELADALRMLEPPSPDWWAPVLTCSALTGDGVDEVWQQVVRHRQVHTASGAFDLRRRQQLHDWVDAMVEDRLLAALHRDPAVVAAREVALAEVDADRLTASAAADRVLRAHRG